MPTEIHGKDSTGSVYPVGTESGTVPAMAISGTVLVPDTVTTSGRWVGTDGTVSIDAFAKIGGRGSNESPDRRAYMALPTNELQTDEHLLGTYSMLAGKDTNGSPLRYDNVVNNDTTSFSEGMYPMAASLFSGGAFTWSPLFLDANGDLFVTIGDVNDVQANVQANGADNISNTAINALRTNSFGMVYDGTTWDRMRGTSADGVLVNLGTNNDITLTSGTLTSITNDVSIDDGGNSITVDGVPELTIIPAITAGSQNINASAYNATSNISNDYILDNVEFNFSTNEARVITISTSGGTNLWTGSTTEKSVVFEEIDHGFNADENFTIDVSQTAGACSMDVVANVREGNSTLGGNPVLGAGTNTIGTAKIESADGPSIDAFGRWRVSEPVTLFDSKQLFDNLPLFWDDSETSGSGTTSTHSTAKAETDMAVGATTAGTRVRQTFQRFNYEPGKSQQILMTGVLGTGASGITRRVGYFDDDNGLFFELAETTLNVVRRTKTSGSVVNNTTAQASWNLDTMDGNGASGVTLDTSKAQIFVIDFEWLSVGRVRFGFMIAGQIIYCHEIKNANVLDVAYMSTPNLPLRYEIANDGTGAASSLKHICSTVISEGGQEGVGTVRYASTGGTHVDANTANTVYALVGIRLKSTHLAENVFIDSVSILAETNDDFEWIVLFNPTVADTFTYSNQTNSAVQIATGATANTVTGGTSIAGGFDAASKDGGATASDIPNALKLGAKIDGTVDEIVLCARPLSANADIQGSITWRELS